MQVDALLRVGMGGGKRSAPHRNQGTLSLIVYLCADFVFLSPHSFKNNHLRFIIFHENDVCVPLCVQIPVLCHIIALFCVYGVRTMGIIFLFLNLYEGVYG